MRQLLLLSGLVVGLLGMSVTGAVVPGNSSTERDLTLGTHDGRSSSSEIFSLYWVAGGKLIAFAAEDNRDDPSLWVMRADGTHRKKVAAHFTEASVSPGGKLVAVIPGAQDTSAPSGPKNLVVRQPTRKHGLTFRLRAPPGTASLAEAPDWAPNERAVAVEIYRETPSDELELIYLADLKRGIRLISRTHRPEDFAPAWSPDSSRIAFFQCGSNLNGTGPCKLMLMRPDGWGRTQLARTTGDPAVPVWSPDGRMLAFTQNFGPMETGNGFTKSRYGIYVIGRDGSGMRRIAATAMRPWAPSDPAWSPDGGRVVFSTNHGLFVYNLHRGTTQRITSMTSGTLSWAPSRKILFTSDAIYTVLPGSRPLKVAS